MRWLIQLSSFAYSYCSAAALAHIRLYLFLTYLKTGWALIIIMTSRTRWEIVIPILLDNIVADRKLNTSHAIYTLSFSCSEALRDRSVLTLLLSALCTCILPLIRFYAFLNFLLLLSAAFI